LTSITDYLVLFLLIFGAWHGWRYGVVRSLIYPFSFLISCIVSILYFQKSHNLGLSLLIGIFGPIAVNILLSFILTIWQKTANCNQPPLLLSRVLGCFLNPLWNISILFVLLVFIARLPSINLLQFKRIQDDINHSLTFSWLDQYVLKDIPSLKQFSNTLTILKDPAHAKALASTKEYQTLINDEKIQNILSDETLRQQIQNGDIGKLLTNPKIQIILKDPELLEKFGNLEKVLMKQKNENEIRPHSQSL